MFLLSHLALNTTRHTGTAGFLKKEQKYGLITLRSVWHIDVGSSERDLQANAGASVCDTEPSFSSEEHMGLKQHPNVLHHSMCDCCLKSPYLFPIFPPTSESLYRQRTRSPVLKELLKPCGSHHTSAVSSASRFTLSNKSETHSENEIVCWLLWKFMCCPSSDYINFPEMQTGIFPVFSGCC